MTNETDMIPNFDCCGVVYVVIDVLQVEGTISSGESFILYNPVVTTYLDIGTDEEPMGIMTVSDVFDECPETAASVVYESLREIYDNVSSYVKVFDTEVQEIREFDLEDFEEEYVPPTTEERISNMKETIIMLQKKLEELEA